MQKSNDQVVRHRLRIALPTNRTFYVGIMAIFADTEPADQEWYFAAAGFRQFPG
jgi:hypothetical protein